MCVYRNNVLRFDLKRRLRINLSIYFNLSMLYYSDSVLFYLTLLFLEQLDLKLTTCYIEIQIEAAIKEK